MIPRETVKVVVREFFPGGEFTDTVFGDRRAALRAVARSRAGAVELTTVYGRRRR